MINIDTLDTIIALVVVILLLSLIVQSIQGLLKKMLKLKSKQIEASLLDLFNAVMRDRAGEAAADAVPSSRATTRLPAAFASAPVVGAGARDLLDAVKRELRELGRVNARGYFMVDSLSKSDLLNVIARVAPGNFGVKLEGAVRAFAELEDAITAARTNGLPEEVSVLWAKFEGALAPLKQQYAALRAGNAVAPGLIVADVLSLRDVVFDEALEILGKAQDAAVQMNNPALKTRIAAVSTAISTARGALDDALGGFRTRLTETEQWFDTTMQSFEERYHRGMRTYAIAIAALVVILLNANVFTLYRKIASNEILRSDLVDAGPKIARMQEEIAKREAELDEAERKAEEARKAKVESGTGAGVTDTGNTDTSTTDTGATDTGTTDTGTTDTGTTDTATTDTTDSATTDSATTDTGTTTATAATVAATPPTPTTREQIEEQKEKLDRLLQMYTDIGLDPISWDGTVEWVQGLVYTNVGVGTWWSRRRGDLETLFGWFLMTLLLSLGAPFWHDALESLFGVKNLLRRRNEQQNVEQAPGAGNPKV